jgi:hypothetical protein
MAFNPENKVSMDELAPSLQKIINDKAQQSDMTTVLNLVNGIRLTISANTPINPVNGKELWVNSSTGYIYQYNNGWQGINTVLSNLTLNIPTSNVGGNIWIE